MKKYIKILLIIMAVIGAGVLLWIYEAKPLIAKLRGEVILPEDITKVEKGDVEVIFQTSGTMAAKQDEKVPSKPSGILQKLYVKEGDNVKKGQELALVKPGRNEFEDYKPIPIYAPAAGKVVKCPSFDYSDNDISTRNLSLPRLGTYLNGTYDNADKADCVMRIVDTRTLQIPLFASEQQVLKLKVGMPAEVKMTALGSDAPALEGKITHISSQIENAGNRWSENKGFLVIVELPNKDENVWLGAKANVKIVTDKHTDILTIPTNALFEKRGQYYVFKYLGNNKYEQAEIKIGLSSTDKVEVTEGLKEGEEVLTILPYGESW